MKVGRHLPKVRAGAAPARAGWTRPLCRAGDDGRTSASGRCADVADDDAPYFSMILVRRPRARSLRAAGHLPHGAALVALSAGGAGAGAPAAAAAAGEPGARPRRTHATAPTSASTIRRRTCARCSRRGTPIVGICAAGILIRALAPLLADKRTEPPVVARRRGRQRRGAAARRPSRRQPAGPRHRRARPAASPRSPRRATCASASASTTRRPAGASPTPKRRSR